jgi:histidine triad (HIT) family protein
MCVFCDIVRGETAVSIVFEDEVSLAFLDHRPLFPGHTLLIPRAHHDTLTDLPDELVQPLFENARALARAMQEGLGAAGTFVAMNNVVSQSVPHFHVHVVPRRFKDGLRGFFWPRTRYESDDAREAVAEVLRSSLRSGAG